MSNIRLIKKAMKNAGVDDTELSKRSGVHVTLLRRYLRNQVDIGVRNAPRIAKALGLSPAEVLYGAEQSERKAS